MTSVEDRIGALDSALFSQLEAQTSDWDRRALLALHASAAAALGTFHYLEVGSYLGGSLQAVMQDPRCLSVISIDSRPAYPPDNRGVGWEYEGNTTAAMIELLRELPEADMRKLVTLETETRQLRPDELPVAPDLCFIDGEHTDEAVLRDAHFCAKAINDSGVISFHDFELVKPAIRQFLRDVWPRVTFAVAFPRLLSESGGRRLCGRDRRPRSAHDEHCRSSG